MFQFRATALFAVVVMLGAALAANSANADTLTPDSFIANTSATFNTVDIYYVDANPAANPWGITSTCPAGCNVNPIGSDSSTPFTVETVTLRDFTGANTAGIDITGGVFTIDLFGNTSIFTTGTDNAPQISNVPGTLATYMFSGDSFCAAAACNTGSNPAVPVSLQSIAPDVFTLTSNSLEVAFSLGTTSTPEPSSALMLGLGLLGLTALGLRRKAKA